MADLDFSRHVSEVPEGQNLPAPYHRSVGPEVTPFPEIQSAVTNYADASNWLSAIGSTVAASASNQLASQLGTEAGKNPHGDIGVPITEFDKVMTQNYARQSQATLGLQADKLITDSNIEMAKAPRLTPDMIARTNKSVSQGLQNIFKNAPSSIQPELYSQFGELQLRQSTDLTGRMITEQKEDQRNNTALATDMNSQHAYSFGMNGNDKAGLAAVENTRKLNESALAARLITPEQAKTNIDSARKSYESGKLINQYEKARADGKGEEFLKNLADKGDKSNPDFQDTTSNLMNYISHQQSLRSQDEQLRMAKFSVSLAKNPMDPDVGNQLQDLKQNVSPLEFQKAQLKYIDALKSFNKENGDLNNALASWNDPESFARLTEKSINKGFDVLTTKYMNQRESEGNPITRDEAEVQVASSAAGSIPVFVKGLNTKAASANPQQIESAAMQVHELREIGAGKSLNGLTKQSDALFTKYDALRASTDPVSAARMATDIVYNQTPEQQQNNKQSWSNYISTATKGGKLHSDFALEQVGLNKNDFISTSMAHVYGTDILETYNSYYQLLNGDKVGALANTKREVEDNYGYTGVNGKSNITLHPIEKTLGYKDSSVVPFIQNDISSQLNKNFLVNKQNYVDNKINEYWEVKPSTHKDRALLFGHDYEPVQVTRHTKVGNKVTSENFDVVIQGNAYNQYDVSVKSDSGMRPLFQVAPYLGIITYTPNKKAIDDAYLASHFKNQTAIMKLTS